MPYLGIHTNKKFDDATAQELMKKASHTVAELLGKPESYVMVALPPPVPMMFAGDDAPLAYLELKSIGLPQSARNGRISLKIGGRPRQDRVGGENRLRSTPGGITNMRRG